MLDQNCNTFDRAAHCRRIASAGGRATVARHGHDHMRRIGRRGWEQTTRRHFRSEHDHAIWLALMGAHVYWKHTSLPMRYDHNGHPIYPEHKPAHPAHKNYTEF